MYRVPVFLDAAMPESADSALLYQADSIAKRVAAELRIQLGAVGEAVPEEDGRLAWYTLPAGIIVAFARDGTTSWNANDPDADSTAASLLGKAFDAVRARGNALINWPKGYDEDSMLVRLSLFPAYMGDMSPGIAFIDGARFRAFYLSEPELIPTDLLPNQTLPDYPLQNERHHVTGSVLLQFVVDSTGHVVANTIHDVWPTGRARQTGGSAERYDDFVSSARDWAGTLRFEPARLGGCPVRQTVRVPLVFAARPRP